VGANLQGGAVAGQVGELGAKSRLSGGDAAFLDHFSILIQDADFGMLVSQV
jgi:hypothetical protein